MPELILNSGGLGMNVGLLFEMAAQRTPDRTALVASDKQWTYRDLYASVSAIADHLLQSGVGPGDRVMTIMKNSPENVITFLATQIIGAVYVPINFRSKWTTIQYHIENSEAKVVVTDGQYFERLSASGITVIIASGTLGSEVWNFESLPLIEDVCARAGEILPSDLSVILYTSGTTGLPKGVPLTHLNSVSRALGLSINHGLKHMSNLKALGLMPLYHTVGLHTVLLGTLLFNGTFYTLGDFEPLNCLDWIESHGINYLFGTPTHLYSLAIANRDAKRDVTSLQHLLYAGAPMTANQVQICTSELCDNFTLIYGNTETYNSLYAREHSDRPGIAKCGIFHRVRVVKLGIGHEPVSDGEIGELIVDIRSPESFQGYLKNDEETAKKIIDGWYHTGDACLLHFGGFVEILGRIDDLIISGGENINPSEVENVLLTCPGIIDVAAIGLPDEIWGSAVTAFVVRQDDNCSISFIDDYLRGSELENYKRPRRVFFVNSIPRNPSGKVLKSELRREFETSFKQDSPSDSGK